MGDAGRSGAADDGASGWLLLVAILALAAVLRAIRLDAGLWYDEIVTLVEYARLPVSEIVTTYTLLNNHVGFSVLARLSLDLFGESAWALRLPAAVLGVASIAALAWLGRRVVGRRQATLACLLLAVSYHHVWFSQNARGYTGLLLLVIVGTAIFDDGLRRPRRGAWAAYAVVLGLALYTHLSAAFAFAGHALAYLALFAAARTRGRAAAYPGARELWPLAGLAGGVGVALLLYAPVLPQMLAAFGAQSGAQAANPKVDSWMDLLWLAQQLLGGLRIGFASLLGGLAVALLGGLGWLVVARREPLFAAVVALPVPLALAALLALSFHLWPRYFFCLIGFAALLLVAGAHAAGGALAHALGAGERAAARSGAGLAWLLIACSALSLPANYRLPKQDFAGARDWVRERRAPGDEVATAGLAILPYREVYAPAWKPVRSAAELAAIREAAAGHTWLVTTLSDYLRAAHPDIAESAERDFSLEARFRGSVGDGDVLVYRSADGR